MIDYSLTQLFFAGSVAGITNTIVLTPVERVKCLLQVIINYTNNFIEKSFLKRLKKLRN
jgi:hypothetical protein